MDSQVPHPHRHEYRKRSYSITFQGLFKYFSFQSFFSVFRRKLFLKDNNRVQSQNILMFIIECTVLYTEKNQVTITK